MRSSGLDKHRRHLLMDYLYSVLSARANLQSGDRETMIYCSTVLIHTVASIQSFVNEHSLPFDLLNKKSYRGQTSRPRESSRACTMTFVACMFVRNLTHKQRCTLQALVEEVGRQRKLN
jgi:hypothetical protein